MSALAPSLRGLGPQLQAMPLLDQISQDDIDHPLLFKHGAAAELVGSDVYGVHGATPARNVTYRELDRRKCDCEEVPDSRLGRVEEVGLRRRRF